MTGIDPTGLSGAEGSWEAASEDEKTHGPLEVINCEMVPLGEVGLEALKLAKQLASEAQMFEKGRVIFGPGGKAALKQAERLSEEYGGKASNWVKKTSSSFSDGAKEKTQFETHWYEDLVSGIRKEYKTVLKYLKGIKIDF